MSTLPKASIRDFFKSGQVKKFGGGELILRGEDPTGVCFIDTGFIKVYSISDTGDKYLHIIYKNGEVFPLIWAVNGVRRRVFYESIGESQIFEVSRQSFTKALAGSNQLANDVMSQLAEQFYIFADRLDNLEYKQAQERIIYRLLFMASRFGRKHDSETVIELPLTHELIAESVNLARETVSRELEKLEHRGLIGRYKNQIIIKKLEVMAESISEPITLDLWGMKKID